MGFLIAGVYKYVKSPNRNKTTHSTTSLNKNHLNALFTFFRQFLFVIKGLGSGFEVWKLMFIESKPFLLWRLFKCTFKQSCNYAKLSRTLRLVRSQDEWDAGSWVQAQFVWLRFWHREAASVTRKASLGMPCTLWLQDIWGHRTQMLSLKMYLNCMVLASVVFLKGRVKYNIHLEHHSKASLSIQSMVECA